MCECPDAELSLADDKHTCEGKMNLVNLLNTTLIIIINRCL